MSMKSTVGLLICQETNRVSLELDDQHGVATGKGAPGLLVYAHDETEGLGFDLGKGTDVDLLPAPDLGKLGDPLRTPLSVLSFGNAVTAVKGWWADEFTFRGFGIGITKPIFRGMLLRPDVGLGVRCSGLAYVYFSKLHLACDILVQHGHVNCQVTRQIRILRSLMRLAKPPFESARFILG